VIAEVHGRDENPLADIEAGYVLADFNDFSSDIAAENMRQLYARQSFPNPDIEVIHGAGFYSHQNLIFARLWIRNIFVAKHFGPAEFVNADGFHGRLLALLKRSITDSSRLERYDDLEGFNTSGAR
jgi:hypothetical protein